MQRLRSAPPHRLLLVGIVLLAALGRGLRLDFQPLWWDEGYSVWFAGQPLLDMIRLTAADIHPPLYYALLHLWTQGMGMSPVVLRSFSIFAGLPAIPLAYALGRDLRGRRVGLLAAALVAINPFAIFYSQEIRMYGLATTFSLAALWSGWRWAQRSSGRRLRWGIAYGLSIVGGLYTLYLFALIPLAQTVWALIYARGRRRAWLSAVAGAAVLYVPWVVYAGPQLLQYVAYKIGKDNDTPLSLLPYVGRHLSAFMVGHLEGNLAWLWPWPLLLLIPVAAALILSRPKSSPRQTPAPELYLLLVLLIPLSIGFGQQLRAPFIPDRFERVLLIAAPALWLLIALGLAQMWRQAPAAALLIAGLLLGLQGISLWGFYSTPRYAERDYRPIIATVQENVQANDSIFAVFPWQIGYFWAYWPPETRPAIIASPNEAWGPDVARVLDARLAQGGVWFPEHLALGGLLESAAEDYLGQHSYQLMNRWYGTETRLTAWTRPGAAAVDTATLPSPLSWQPGITLTQATVKRDARRIYFDLAWQGSQPLRADELTFSLWLSGPAGYRWAQRDVNPFAQPWPALEASAGPWRNSDRIALTLPGGTPPGEYDVWAALLNAQDQPLVLAGDNPAAQAWLGTLQVPLLSPEGATLPAEYAADVAGTGWHFRGHSRNDAPYLPGDDIRLSLFWQADAVPQVDYFVFAQLLDDRGQVVAGLEEPPLAWLPTSQWPASVPIRSQHRLRIPAALAPGHYRLITGLFDRQTGARVMWGGDDFLPLAEIDIDARPHDFATPHPQNPLDLTLAGGHRLVGYDLVAGESPGSPVNITLYWIPAAATEQRYSSFVHLLDANDELRGQSDTEPAQGRHPSTSWLAGEVIGDAHTLTLPALRPRPPYYLAIGLYDPQTAARLPFVDAAGNILSDHIILPLNP
ncbi:MAG: phospholipid carrier-dependent glycosyltransferase [Chloroflexi bacterium]|nr:phospholipid carrier-dependent glycosyltransferase [Chloroflexota bacterium]